MKPCKSRKNCEIFKRKK